MGPRSHERGNDTVLASVPVYLSTASMGPRSHERGNTNVVLCGRKPSVELQWGRVLMNAETTQYIPFGHRGGGLQWGRVLMNAETRGRVFYRLSVSVLQWGRVLMNAET